jgi:choline dehydrogenase-like flavoprotein
MDKRSKPLLFLASKEGSHPLHFHAEHRPSRASCIGLASERDRLGLCRALIDLRFSDEDGLGIVRAHATLDRALKENRIGELVYTESSDQRVSGVLRGAKDGFHQIGSTRMANTPRQGVVNADCRVFEFGNLFIAGSSVFPTSGQANPTFPAVTLALRLAAHLERQFKTCPTKYTLQ